MMIKERLCSLPLEKLQEVARRSNISFYQDMEREKLVELIIDAMEEEQEEKSAQNNMAVNIETKKFNTNIMEELNIDYDEDFVLPERYNETCMMFMPRDPSWGFLYWDVEEKVRKAIEQNDEFNSIFIRVYQLDNADEDVSEASDFFDIPIQFGDRRRYINLHENDTWYRAELRVLIGERESVIVGSNVIKTSREHVMPPLGEDHENSDLLIRLSGFSTDFGTFPGREAETTMRHRINPIAEGEENS